MIKWEDIEVGQVVEVIFEGDEYWEIVQKLGDHRLKIIYIKFPSFYSDTYKEGKTVTLDTSSAFFSRRNFRLSKKYNTPLWRLLLNPSLQLEQEKL